MRPSEFVPPPASGEFGGVPSEGLVRWLSRSLGLVILMIAGSGAAAGEEDWVPVPPQPSGSKWDWARLDTGEWIKGEMIVLQKEVMLFESDKFNEVEIDWEDVVDLRLVRPRIFRRRGGRIYNGMGEIRDGILRVRTRQDEIVEFAGKEIISIVYTSEQELRNWRARAGVNLAARAGNTDQQDVSANAKIRRDTVYTRWQTDYVGTFGEVDGNQTANNHRASTRFDILLTEYFFLRVPFFEFFYDEFQNIDGRYTAGAGLGYQPIDTKLVELMFTLGPGVQITRYDGGEQDEDAAVVFGSGLYFDFPRDIDLDLDYHVQLIPTDVGKTNHAASAVLSFEVWDPIDLDIGAYLDRIEKPERDGNGIRPKRNDFRLTVGLSLDF